MVCINVDTGPSSTQLLSVLYALAQMAGAELLTQDVSESQVAVEFPDDPRVRWHQRVLMADLGGGRHIAASPDLELSKIDLNNFTVKSLLRAAPFPSSILNDVYIFDPISAVDLDRLRVESRAMARVLGASVSAVAASPEGSRWSHADPGVVNFGQEVGLDIVGDPTRFDVRGSSALAAAFNEPTFVFCENVAVEDEAKWKSFKLTGPGKDPRIEPLTFEGEYRQRLTLDVLTRDLASDTKRPNDFPLPGPSAYAELMHGVKASGVGLGGFRNYWSRASGISPTCGVALEHKVQFESLDHGLTWDGIRGRESAMVEFMSRRVLQTHRATKRSPKHPDFDGLEAMLTSRLDESGGVVATKFDQFIAEQQRTQAVIMKQARLHAEELEHDQKKGRKDGKKGDNA